MTAPSAAVVASKAGGPSGLGLDGRRRFDGGRRFDELGDWQGTGSIFRLSG